MICGYKNDTDEHNDVDDKSLIVKPFTHYQIFLSQLFDYEKSFLFM